jgi:hypothetical protein
MTERRLFKWTTVTTQDELEEFYRSIIDKLKKVGLEHGHAICIHGSLRRDMDIVAIPWVEDACDKDVLVRALHEAACGLVQPVYQWETKPHGRQATTFPICWSEYKATSAGHIDLSVTPII